MPPTSRISRLSTLAKTGRRMKRSVKAFMRSPSRSRRFSRRRQRGALVDRDRRIGLQLDLPGCHHALALLGPLLDRDPLSARRANANEAAFSDERARALLGRRGLAGLRRRRLHHEYVVA